MTFWVDTIIEVTQTVLAAPFLNVLSPKVTGLRKRQKNGIKGH